MNPAMNPALNPAMNDGSSWQPLLEELDRWKAEGRTLRLWLRDDDAFEPTPALARLCQLTERFAVPLLLAVIPKNAKQSLADALVSYPLVTPCQHGYSHKNHAPAGERSQEIGLHRPSAEVLEELVIGREILEALFQKRFCKALVPPWNRMDEIFLDLLPSCELTAVSRFGPVSYAGSIPHAVHLPQVNSNIDIINWRNGRVGRPHTELVNKLLAELVLAKQLNTPIGILSHHLAHDETAWSFLYDMFRHTTAHPAVSWVQFNALCHETGFV